jgi:hypothetical protein
VDPVQLQRWAAGNEASAKRRIERGTFQELAVDFEAGEGYERWYLAPDWAPYRGYFNWAEGKVKQAAADGGDRALLELAEKQLLVANWETAWHTPSAGPHGDPETNGHASPWAKALTSHSRHAAVTADAAVWMRRNDGAPHAEVCDIDNDNEQEIVLKNRHLYVVISPRCGGRVTAMFSVSGDRGAMVAGNPCDDWNWMEELNSYMDVPRNHPGCFADVGFEHEAFVHEVVSAEGDAASVRLCASNGVEKLFELRGDSAALRVRYAVPQSMPAFATECGLSPDYLTLLRNGSVSLASIERGGVRGCRAGDVSVWLKPQPRAARWETPFQPRCGHCHMFRIASEARSFWIDLGVTVHARRSVSRRRRVSRAAAAQI